MRSSTPLGHKVIALLIAAAVAYGVHAWFSRKAVQSATTAELSFDAHAAQRFDPGLVQASEPAVAFAQSILTDPLVAGLSKSAYLSASAMTGRVGEFRSRLELTQPSPQVLGVRFSDADPARAAATANAVADALIAWAPSPNGPAPVALPPADPSQSAASAQPVAAPPPAAVPAKSVPQSSAQPNSPLLASLGELQTQLLSTSRKLDQLGPEPRSASLYGGYGREGASYAEFQQQQFLKSQVRAAEKKIDDLRAHAADSSADSGVRARLAEIQQALSSIFAAGTAGIDARQLRRERTQLTEAIGVVETQRQAIEKETAAPSASSAETAAQTPAPSAPAPQAPASSAPNPDQASSEAAQANPAPQSAPVPVAASAPPFADSSLPNPLRLTRPAGAAAIVLWWPTPLAAGMLCGLLYWVIAALRHRSLAYAEETPRYSQHLITPDEPVVTLDEPVGAVPVPAAEVPASSLFHHDSFRRAAFSYEPAPLEGGPVSEIAPISEGSPARGQDPAETGDGSRRSNTPDRLAG